MTTFNERMTLGRPRGGLLLMSLVGVLVAPRAAAAQAHDPTLAGEIVRRVAEHWGGPARLADMKLLRVQVRYAGHDYPVTVDLARPSRVRVQGGTRYVSVFDGERAAFLFDHDRQGNRQGPRLVPAGEAKDWELEAAWLFPAFFDHPATYGGRTLVGADSAHVLEVALPLGAEVDYFVHPTTFQVVRAEAKTVIDGTTYRMGRTYRDFAPMGGVTYPTRMEAFFGDADPEPATVESLAVEASFPEGHFDLPASLTASDASGDTGVVTAAELQARAAALLTRAAEAHGGWARLRRLRTVTFDARMERGYLGQNPTPEDEGARLTPSHYRVTWDLELGGAVAEIYQPADAPEPVARAVLRPDETFLAVPSQGVVQRIPPMDSPPWSWFVRDAVFAPALLLDAAAASESLRPAEGTASDGGAPGVTFVDGQGRVETLWFSPETGLLQRRERVIDHPQWGRTLETTAFDDYAPEEGVEAPRRVTVAEGAQVLSRARLGPATVNDVDAEALFARPAGARVVAGQMPTGADAVRRTEELAPGVFQVMNAIPGYNQTYVAFEDEVVLIEPLGGPRAVEAVLAEIRARFPDKPVSAAVVTHHHFDHTDGLLPILARGIAVYAPTGMDTFIGRMVAAPRTDPGSGPVPAATLRAVTTPVTVGDGANRFILIDVGPNPHAQALLVAYFPAHRLLLVPDVYGYLPGYTPPPLLVSFADELATLGLDVERFATAHTAPTTYAEYEAMVAAARAQMGGGR